MITSLCNRTKFRYQVAFLLMLLGGISASAQVSITPSTPPAVNSGQTFTFTASVAEGGAVTWSCPGCQGSINASTGVYTAPATVHAQQSFGGYQLLPNDHIYNTRIDSLPVNANSATWIAGAGTVPFSYIELSFPSNYVNGATPTQSQSFLYTPGNNGSFQIPPPSVLRIETGWYTRTDLNQDHHILSVDTTTGTVQEIYDPVPVGALTSQGCATCTAMSGVRYSNSTYDLPNSQGGGVDAAGLYVTPLELRLQEMEQAVATSGTIKHALRMTLQNGYLHHAYIWPGTAFASAGAGVNFYGARFRLKAGFNTAGYSPIAQILLTQLKQYGVIIADGGTGWATQPEYTKWPAAYLAAFNEIGGAHIAPSNFEAVDESGLEVSPTSGLTTTGETVVATGVMNPAHSARQQVVLTGVTITLPNDDLHIQAGAAAQQLAAFIHGASNTGINWAMSPAVGTLTAGGQYTPPSNIPSVSATTVTATSAADPTVAAALTLTVLPAGTIRLVLGQSAPYKDSHGNVWQNETGSDGCIAYDSGGSWPSTPDITLYKIPCYSYNDDRFNFTVPNGNYLITGKFAETEMGAAGHRLMNLETQGQVVNSNVDLYVLSGGVQNKPIDLTIPATVTNGSLSFVLRAVIGQPSISALQIVPVSLSGAETPGPPAPPSNMQIQVK